MVPPWFRRGSAMVPPWFRRGSAMVPPWFRRGSAVVPPWFRRGSAVVPPWFRHGSAQKNESSTWYKMWTLSFCLRSHPKPCKGGIVPYIWNYVAPTTLLLWGTWNVGLTPHANLCRPFRALPTLNRCYLKSVTGDFAMIVDDWLLMSDYWLLISDYWLVLVR